ncbi:MAG: glutathione S-transferase family protein [Pseudomonadota bacterium]
MSPLRLIGFSASIYSWSVRLALAETGQVADWVEANPFAGPVTDHPFDRVPVLWVGETRLYETAAILEWLFPPVADRMVAAQARQVGCIADAYAYWPLVRQVYAQAVFRPAMGEAADPGEVAEGLLAAEPVLAALEEIAQGGAVLQPGHAMTAADCHLAPMIGAFAAAPEGRALLNRQPALGAWYAHVAARPSWAETCPDPRIIAP